MTALVDGLRACAICGDPIRLDPVFGWLHTDRPDGQSHNHDASSNIEPSSCAASARTTRQPPVHSAGSPRLSAPVEPSGPPGAETRPRLAADSEGGYHPDDTCALCGAEPSEPHQPWCQLAPDDLKAKAEADYFAKQCEWWGRQLQTDRLRPGREAS